MPSKTKELSTMEQESSIDKSDSIDKSTAIKDKKVKKGENGNKKASSKTPSKPKKITKKLLRQKFGPYDTVCKAAIDKLVNDGIIQNPRQYVIGRTCTDLTGSTLLDLAMKDKEHLPKLCLTLCDEYEKYMKEVEAKKEETKRKRRKSLDRSSSDDLEDYSFSDSSVESSDEDEDLPDLPDDDEESEDSPKKNNKQK